MSPQGRLERRDCRKQKPAPDPVIRCLDTLNCSAEDSLGLGDADYDAAAYRAAGLLALESRIVACNKSIRALG